MAELKTDDPTKLGSLLNETRGAAVWGRYANAVFEAAMRVRAWRPVSSSRAGCAGGTGRVIVKRGADAASVVAGGGVISSSRG